MDSYTQLTEIIRAGNRIVFFGGAGVSTESGIPDFRGKNGIYTAASPTDISPEEMLHCNFLRRYPDRFMKYYREHMIFPDAKPNPAHVALARLEAEGKLTAVITQNIDGLHQKAGSRNVIELHGSTLRNYCTVCGAVYGIESVTEHPSVPICDVCGGLIRPDVVLYGEPLNSKGLSLAREAVRSADVMLVGGTSLTVYPAAGLVAEFSGEHLVIINQTPTPYDSLAVSVIRDPIGAVFQRIMEAL